MVKILSLSDLLKNKKVFEKVAEDTSNGTKQLQLRMLRIQQGVWHRKSRAIIIFEGFDAAGKGGAIRKLTEVLDPRSVRVHTIGPPTEEDQGKHWLYRFWRCLPSPGMIAIFDRSWYGRVLVERVDGLTDKTHWKSAFLEINAFEKMLQDDGIDIIKIFLAIAKDEQLRRFEERLLDPYKQWKLTNDDLRARKRWNLYVEAVDDLLRITNTKLSPWNLIPANNKKFTRKEVLRLVTSRLCSCEAWITKQAENLGQRTLKHELKLLGQKDGEKCL
jgi:polyphosphate kinase 2 (PPK2 family)